MLEKGEAWVKAIGLFFILLYEFKANNVVCVFFISL